MASQEISLSVVATSRNDNHGGSLTARMQHFVDGFAAQCRRHGLSAELILVEWNPPADRPPLAEALRWPEDEGPFEIRVITVPRSLHSQFAHADKLPLFQMIAKNVGIRRARGRFVLATNIDILFSDDLVIHMRDRLKSGHLYRADRCDVPPDVPTGVEFDEVLAYCEREMFRINRLGCTVVKRGERWVHLQPWKARLRQLWQNLLPFTSSWRSARERWRRATLRERLTKMARLFKEFVSQLRRSVLGRLWDPLRRLHTNACGDFTLLSREDWSELRGYPEWEMYSWHIDSVVIYQANYSGIRHAILPRSCRAYHIEHGVGSGYTPESPEALFNRLKDRGVPFLDWPDCLRIVADMDLKKKAGEPVIYNSDHWGFADEELPECFVYPRPGEARMATGS